MNKYDEAVAALAPPEPFDARVFLADEACSQDVCDFVLGLALAFDDFRDVILGQQVVLDDKVAFHYDQKALASAYRSLFVDGGETPYISSGPSMAKTRSTSLTRQLNTTSAGLVT